MMRSILTLLVISTLISGCSGRSEPIPEQPVYSGFGGMSEWNIEPEIYLYHYENGFFGSDALGYDELLQKVWSRLGGAVTCKVPYNKRDMISLLEENFAESSITHELNGIGFHAVQTRKVPGFCSEKRISEIRSALRRYQRGRF